MISFRYSRRDIFGVSEYTEDTKNNELQKDTQTAFRLFSRDVNSAICYSDFRDYSEVIFHWDSMNDFENRIVTMKLFRSWNDYDVVRISLSSLKKEIYALYDKTSGKKEG